jgi:circadian clock protein KaiB
MGQPGAVRPTNIERREGLRLSTYVLKLYVTGANPRTERAVANLRHICDSELTGRYTLAIIDVLEDPEAAERDRVLATPTLIKELPLPLRRVIGDLSDHAKVLLALEVRGADFLVPRDLSVPRTAST